MFRELFLSILLIKFAFSATVHTERIEGMILLLLRWNL